MTTAAAPVKPETTDAPVEKKLVSGKEHDGLGGPIVVNAKDGAYAKAFGGDFVITYDDDSQEVITKDAVRVLGIILPPVVKTVKQLAKEKEEAEKKAAEATKAPEVKK